MTLSSLTLLSSLSGDHHYPQLNWTDHKYYSYKMAIVFSRCWIKKSIYDFFWDPKSEAWYPGYPVTCPRLLPLSTCHKWGTYWNIDNSAQEIRCIPGESWPLTLHPINHPLHSLSLPPCTMYKMHSSYSARLSQQHLSNPWPLPRRRVGSKYLSNHHLQVPCKVHTIPDLRDGQ